MGLTLPTAAPPCGGGGGGEPPHHHHTFPLIVTKDLFSIVASSQACDGHRESWRRLVGASLGLNAATSCRRCDVFRRWEGRARMPNRCSPTCHQISSGATSQPIRRSHWWRRAVRPAPVRDQVTRSLLADGGASAVDARATTRCAAEAAPADAGRRRHQCSSTFLILAKHISIPFTSEGTVVHGLVTSLSVIALASVSSFVGTPVLGATGSVQEHR